MSSNNFYKCGWITWWENINFLILNLYDLTSHGSLSGMISTEIFSKDLK